MWIKIKILICILFLYAISSYAKTVEDFQNFSSSHAVLNNIENVYPANYYYSTRGYALAVVRDIGVHKECAAAAADWSDSNELMINFSSIQNWIGYRYFIVWVQDLANHSSQNSGAHSLQMSFNDGNEFWFHDEGFTDDQWHQVVIYLTNTGLTDPYFDVCSETTQYNCTTDGFSMPLWQANDPYYVGNGIIDLGSVSSFKISFGSTSPILGEFLLDDLMVVNEFDRSDPPVFENYTTYMQDTMTNIKLHFSAQMDSDSVVNSGVQLYSSTNLVSYSVDYNQITRDVTVTPAVPFSFNTNYKIVLTPDLMFLGQTPIRNELQYNICFSSNIELGADPGAVYFKEAGLTVVFPAGSLGQNEYFSAYRIEGKTNIIDNKIIRTVSEYAVLPPVRFNQKVKFIIDLNNPYYNDLGKMKVFLREGDSYSEVQSEYDPNSGLLTVYSYTSGTFVLAEIDSSVSIVNYLVKIDRIENNIFQPDRNDLKIYLSYGQGISSVRTSIFTPSGLLVHESTSPLNPNIALTWDGTDNIGRELSAGIYIMRIIVSAEREDVEEFYGWPENKGQSQSIQIPVVLYRE